MRLTSSPLFLIPCKNRGILLEVGGAQVEWSDGTWDCTTLATIPDLVFVDGWVPFIDALNFFSLFVGSKFAGYVSTFHVCSSVSSQSHPWIYFHQFISIVKGSYESRKYQKLVGWKIKIRLSEPLYHLIMMLNVERVFNSVVLPFPGFAFCKLLLELR